MLRGLILLAMVAVVTFLAMPFAMTSRALAEHGVTIPGKVSHKSEWVWVRYSSWELSREITVEYTVPESSSAGFFSVHPSVEQYDALHTGQVVDVRYLPRKDVPDVPGAKLWADMHALTVAQLANIEGVSRFDQLKTPSVILTFFILGAIGVLLILWRITRWSALGWAAALGVLPIVAMIFLSGFPRATPAPAADVRRAAGRVLSVGRIDKLFGGSRSRGVVAEQPMDVVGVEFVPEGRTEPVVAVDLIDRGSLAGLREKGLVTVKYEAASPRTAYLEGAARTFPERNFSGTVWVGVLYVVVTVGMLGAVYLFGKGYDRLVKRTR